MIKCKKEYYAIDFLTTGRDIFCCPFHEHEFNSKEKECNQIKSYDGRYFNVVPNGQN